MVSTPEAPFARVVGRVVRPDGTAAAGRLTLTPDAQHPNATLPGGEVVVVPSTVVDLDGEGRVASTVDGVPAPWVDVIAPGGSVEPAGSWTYTVTLSVPGSTWWSRHVTLAQGTVVDLTDLAPAAEYRGDAVTISEGAAQAAAESAQAAADALARAEADIAAGLTVGPPGVGVSSITTADGDGTATVTLTDGSTSDLLLPRGPQGVGVSSITNPDGDATALVTLTDGSSTDLALPTVAQPVFTMETPTTLAAGSQATAKLSGSYQNLAISLGIPAVATGSTSATQIIGAGRPDVASSMDANTQALVSAAPVGASFNSTDGAGTGAWAWQKTGAGWVVTMGDTGWRAVDPEAKYAVKIRRTNQSIAFSFNVSQPAVAMPDWRFPAGFSPSGFFDLERAMYRGGTTTITGYFRIIGGILKYNGSLSAINATALEAFPTYDAWPLTLPGTPYNQ